MRLTILVAVAATLALGTPAFAAKGLSTAQHYGSYASVSPDSGTCGNVWANDTFDRDYTVSTVPNRDGTYTVTEQFKDGTFVTVAGPSPGACDTNPGGTVSDGLTGKMHGSFTIVVSGGTYDPAATCGSPCYTADFISAVFGSGATYDIPSWTFTYSAKNKQQWVNASPDKGGNSGDITG